MAANNIKEYIAELKSVILQLETDNAILRIQVENEKRRRDALMRKYNELINVNSNKDIDR